MRSIGIICECNPFHGGHEYLIQRARAGGEASVICVMSGPFVQRGEAAVSDAYTRAEILIRGGADAVVELPFPYAAASAEHFARAGVDILARLGVQELWFGSECGDLARITRLAALADSPTFRERYEATAARSEGTAQAYFDLLCEMSGERDAAFLSNDILAISYLRAISSQKADITPFTVKREGGRYLDETIGEGFPSATALRREWIQNGLASILPHLPSATADVLARERSEKPNELCYAERLILGHFRLTSPDVLEQAAELSGGLGMRMADLVNKAETLEDFLALCATKKYPNARLRRGVLYALTATFAEDLRRPPSYTRLLAANATGCRFLANARKNAEICVVTRRTDLSKTEDATRQAELERRALALYALCKPHSEKVEQWRRVPIIL